MWWKLLLAIPFFLSSSVGGIALNDSDSVEHPLQSGQEHSALGSPILPHQVHLGSKSGSEPSPEIIYHRAWQLIDDEYVDATFNQQSWARWEHRYDGKMKDLADAHKSIETMLASLGDRYTRFLDKEAFADEKSQIDAKLFGIGIQIALDEKRRIIIFNSYEGTPAEKAGLRAADEIVSINGKATKGLSVDEAAKLIRGQADTAVSLTLKRDEKEPFTVIVTRAEIPVRAVQSVRMLDARIGYIRLNSFISQQSTVEMRDALSQLSGAQGIILDLRDNPGGLLSNAIEIANLFLDSGNIVSTVDREEYKTSAHADGKPVSHQPLVVLINHGSASAAEITSGALHDNERAKLVGQKSFGKGLVQGINRLGDGSGMNVTIAKYLTPNDTDINKKGIEPDFDIEVTDRDTREGKGPWWLDPSMPRLRRKPEDFRDLQLKKAFEVLKQEVKVASPLAIGPH